MCIGQKVGVRGSTSTPKPTFDFTVGQRVEVYGSPNPVMRGQRGTVLERFNNVSDALDSDPKISELGRAMVFLTVPTEFHTAPYYKLDLPDDPDGDYVQYIPEAHLRAA